MTSDERAEEYREEARRDEAEEWSCPCCGKLLHRSKYFDEGRLVESGAFCKCGYASGTSYGDGYLDLPDGWIENDEGEIIKMQEGNIDE